MQLTHKVWGSSVIISVVASGSLLLSPPEAKADGFTDALDCAALYGFDCAHAGDAKNWAESVTAWKFPGAAHNNMADAFRHCSWIGAIATRVGQQDAYTIGYIHERNSGGPTSEFEMDDWNNFVGSGIGEVAVASGTSDQWGYVLEQCDAKARNYELYGLDGEQGNY